MAVSKAKARRAAVFFLTLLGGAFIALFAYNLYLKIGPRQLDVPNVPFGLAGGTRLHDVAARTGDGGVFILGMDIALHCSPFRKQMCIIPFFGFWRK